MLIPFLIKENFIISLQFIKLCWMLNIHFTFLIISNYISYIHKEVVDAVFHFILTSLQHINLCWMLLAHCLSISTTHRLVLDAVFPFILAILQYIN